MQKTLYIPLDTTLDDTVECEKLVKRGDTLKLQIKVFTNGVLADLTGQSIDLILKKADNTLIEYTINSSDIANGIVTATPSQQSTLASGVVSGELQIYTDGTLASSNTFTFNVDASLADDVIEVSKNDIQILSELKALIADGQVKINTYEENILAIGNTIEAVEALANVKLYIDTNLPALQSANAQATVNIANETARNDTASQNISDLDARNNTASQNINDLDAKNSTASANISSLDSKNSIATQNISDLGTRNNTASSNISSLDSKNSTASTNIANLDSENVRAESNRQALANFGDATQLTLDVTALKNEVESARGTSENLDERFDGIDSSLLESTNILMPDTGSTENAILLNISAFKNNTKYSFKANSASSGNVTINGKTFKKLDGTQISSGGVKANKVYDFYYDSTADCVFILAKAEGDATDADVLAGKIYSNGDDVGRGGTMPNRAGDTACIASSVSGTTLKLRASGGYRDGVDDNVTITDANFIAANILSGKSVFGLAGSYNVLVPIAGTTCLLYKDTTAKSFGNYTDWAAEYLATFSGTSGVLTVSYQFKALSDPAYWQQAQIYINGVARGTLRTAPSQTFTTYTETFSVNNGDIISLYVKCYNQNAASAGGGQVSNFKITCGNANATFS